MGIVNSRVKNECDPALALLADYVQDKTFVLQIGAVLGLGLAYVGTARSDVIDLIIPAIEHATGAEQIAITCLGTFASNLQVLKNNYDVSFYFYYFSMRFNSCRYM